MSGFTRRFRAGERQHFGNDAGRKRSPAGACASFRARDHRSLPRAISLLPAPNGRAADAGLMSDLQDRQAISRKKNDPPPLHMLERAITVACDGRQTRAIFSCEGDVDGLGQVTRLAYSEKNVNPMSASLH